MRRFLPPQNKEYFLTLRCSDLLMQGQSSDGSGVNEARVPCQEAGAAAEALTAPGGAGLAKPCRAGWLCAPAQVLLGALLLAEMSLLHCSC